MSIQNQVNFLYKKNNVSIEEKMSVADIQKEKSIHDSFARLICSNRGYKILVFCLIKIILLRLLMEG